ncbi:hypothetical protein PIB30_089726 [Stylosanthes scabra]|uniref:Uncharacterized protein n=1 Tax=Stylosanthes scabra TaxID=79078 RepID=A0ABU6VSI5_9FABA|nr:hypothetical protein [Stylosanthes scabra]
MIGVSFEPLNASTSTSAFARHVSPVSSEWIGNKSKFKCRWIIDHSDAKVGVFLDSLLGDMEKQSRFDHLRLKMVEVEGVGRSILPTPNIPAGSARASAPSSQAMVLPGRSSRAAKSKKMPPTTSAEKPICLDGEEGAKEDPFADLKQKRWKRKIHESFPEYVVLGDVAAWEHEVNPLDRAIPEGFNFRVALDSGITQSSVRKALEPVPPEQLLGTAHRYTCKLTACLQVGIESALSHKLKMEKKLAAANDQVVVLTVERDTTLTSPPLQAKIVSLTEQLYVAQGEHLSALEQLSQVEEDSKVQVVELQSCRVALEEEQRKVEALTHSLEEKQTTLGTMINLILMEGLAAEIEEIVQETFEILMDQVRHINPVVDFSVITLDTRWYPKGQRIYNPKEEAGEYSEPVAEVHLEPLEGSQ